MSEWNIEKLGDVAVTIQPGPFGSQLHRTDYSETGIPIIMPKDMIGGHIDHTNLSFVSEEHVKRLSRHQVHTGDLMVARKGDVRKCVYISEKENGWMTGSDCLKVTLDNSKCVSRFIYYQLRTPFVGKWLETISIGSTMPSINSGLLSSIEIHLPTIEIQQKITKILKCYDDLIENNNRQMKLLEEAAQRLYKEWFVDLHFPGYENCKIVNGVPEGWRVSTVSDCSKLLRRGISPRYNDKGKYTVISQKCIRQLEMDVHESRRQEKEYLPELNLLDEDTLICSTGIGTLGRVGQVFGNYPNTTFDSHVTCVRAKDIIGGNYLFWTIKNLEPLLKGLGRGSTNQQELYKNVIEMQKVLVPDEQIMLEFENRAYNIHKAVINAIESKELATEARDRLLPKLMSGEIEV